MTGIKIVLVGPSGVGKTILYRRLTNQNINQATLPTRGADFCNISKNVLAVERKFCFWDTAGQELLRAIPSVYYQDTALVLICCDLSSHPNSELISFWVNETKGHTSAIPCVLVGTKYENNEVAYEELRAVARQLNISNVIAVNALSGVNIELLWDKIYESLFYHPIFVANNEISEVSEESLIIKIPKDIYEYYQSSASEASVTLKKQLDLLLSQCASFYKETERFVNAPQSSGKRCEEKAMQGEIIRLYNRLHSLVRELESTLQPKEQKFLTNLISILFGLLGGFGIGLSSYYLLGMLSITILGIAAPYIAGSIIALLGLLAFGLVTHNIISNLYRKHNRNQAIKGDESAALLSLNKMSQQASILFAISVEKNIKKRLKETNCHDSARYLP